MPQRQHLQVTVAIPVAVMVVVRTPAAVMAVATTAAAMAEAVPIRAAVMVAAGPARATAMVAATMGEGMVVALVPVRAQVPATVMAMAMVPDNRAATVMRCMSRKVRPSRSSMTTSPSG